eukprot:CAMPEP_0201575514 /NCGR_PEP_ID=MMETSP0190_2-20130828/20757_1 /ASSEMBLY_ACC=CAM_ASM_000263 /TAXON_ID=37353 /ORGANISM="Rosalina sp." /LENGTH=37 /DNA_ID= /DNA_START= /DNA_END= /DNA_ORIENTATION=
MEPIGNVLLKELGFDFIKWWNGIEDHEEDDFDFEDES